MADEEKMEEEEKQLKSLADNDAERAVAREETLKMLRQGRVNGIACPTCGEELKDVLPTHIVIDVEDGIRRQNIFCSNESCDYTGLRVD